jgi:hypothetical protein
MFGIFRVTSRGYLIRIGCQTADSLAAPLGRSAGFQPARPEVGTLPAMRSAWLWQIATPELADRTDSPREKEWRSVKSLRRKGCDRLAFVKLEGTGLNQTTL